MRTAGFSPLKGRRRMTYCRYLKIVAPKMKVCVLPKLFWVVFFLTFGKKYS